MNDKINEALLSSLVREVDQFPAAVPIGAMRRHIYDNGYYEEPGLRFDADDFKVGLHYAGLTVLARDIHYYLADHPRDDATLFEEVVSLVHADDGKLYRSSAFPNYEGLPVTDLPKGLAAAADAGRFVIAPLADDAIVHEWTFKPGKKLFVKFGCKFKETICGKDDPYEQFTDGLISQAALPTAIASNILIVGFSAATLGYPLAVYLGILLVKTGLKTYCEN